MEEINYALNWWATVFYGTFWFFVKALFVIGLFGYFRLCFIKQEEGKDRLVQKLGGGFSHIIFHTNARKKELVDGSIVDLEPGDQGPFEIFGYQWRGWFPFYRDFYIKAVKTRIENGEKSVILASLSSNEKIIQSFVTKDADGKPNKEEHVVAAFVDVNYIRTAGTNIFIPFDGSETGKPSEGSDQSDFENIYVEGNAPLLFEITNFEKALRNGGGNFYEILTTGVRATIDNAIAQKDYASFIQSPDETGNIENTKAYIAHAVLLLNEDMTSQGGSASYQDLFGLRILKVTITNKGLGSKSKAIAEAIEKTRLEREIAEQTDIQATAEAKKKKTVAQGEADAIKTLAKAQAQQIRDIGNAENEIREKRIVDPDTAAIANAIATTNGTFVSGSGGNPLTPILDIGKKNSKKIEDQKDASDSKTDKPKKND